MYYSEIKRHIIGKRYFWSYYIIIFTSLVLVSLSFYTNILSLLIFWLSIMSLVCIMLNFYRCRKFYNFYNLFYKENKIHFYKIVIVKEKYKMQVPNNTYYATIHPSPKSTNAACIETEDLLLIFFSIQYFGIFQLVLKPFVFIKSDKAIDIKDKNVNIIQNFEIVDTEQGRMVIFPNKHGIKKMMIP